MIDILLVTIPSDCNIRKKGKEKVRKYQGLKEELERMWRVKALVVPLVIGPLAFGAVTSKLGQWQHQIPGVTPKTSHQIPLNYANTHLNNH